MALRKTDEANFIPSLIDVTRFSEGEKEGGLFYMNMKNKPPSLI